MRRVVIDPLKVAVRLVLHLPRQGTLRVGKQGGNVAAANLLDGVVGGDGGGRGGRPGPARGRGTGLRLASWPWCWWEHRTFWTEKGTTILLSADTTERQITHNPRFFVRLHR